MTGVIACLLIQTVMKKIECGKLIVMGEVALFPSKICAIVHALGNSGLH